MWGIRQPWLSGVFLSSACTLRCALVLSFLVSTGCARQTAPLASDLPPNIDGTGEPGERSWWFTSELRAGSVHHFRVDHQSTIIDRSRKTEQHVDQQAEFSVEFTAPEAGAGGCVLRVLPPAPSTDLTADITLLALHLLATHSPDGVILTRNAVLVHDKPLLRGPWRAGDRFSIFGFSAFVLLFVNDYMFGVMHFDVEAANRNGAQLTCEFWAGKERPALIGQGELAFESDAQGLTGIFARWERTYESEWREARVMITRVAIGEAGETCVAPELASKQQSDSGR